MFHYCKILWIQSNRIIPKEILLKHLVAIYALAVVYSLYHETLVYGHLKDLTVKLSIKREKCFLFI